MWFDSKLGCKIIKKPAVSERNGLWFDSKLGCKIIWKEIVLPKESCGLILNLGVK